VAQNWPPPKRGLTGTINCSCCAVPLTCEPPLNPPIVRSLILRVAVSRQDLRQQGYNVGDIPEKEEDLIKSVLNDPEVLCSLPLIPNPLTLSLI